MSAGIVTVTKKSARPRVEFKRILVATDFSEGARAALESALAFARYFDAKLYLVHVLPSQFFDFFSSRESPGEALANAREYAKGQFCRLVESVEWGSVQHEEILEEGPVWPALLNIIRAQQIDLVAMGTYGRAARTKLLLGSVTEEIFRVADFPTLTVGPQVARPSGERIGISRVLFATNFKPHAERAAGVAFTLEREHQAHLTAVHVVETSTTGQQTREGHDIVRDFMMQRMRKAVPEECQGKCEPSLLVRFGQPVEEILRAVVEDRSDLIVLGLLPSTKTAGQLPSATAYKIVCQAPCPVLTFRK